MGTCLSRCYPETNTSTNGFTGNLKGHDRSNIKCEYRRIFRGHRSTGDDLKKWSSSTQKKHGSSPSKNSQQISHSIHSDRCLPTLPGEFQEVRNYVANNKINQCNSGQLESQNHNNCLNVTEPHDFEIDGIDSELAVGKVKHKAWDIKYSDSNIDALFKHYSDTDQDCILAGGVEKLCVDLCLQPDDFRILLVAWYCEAEMMCRFTKEEFVRGLHKLKVDSIQKLRSKIFTGCGCKKCCHARSFPAGLVNESKEVNLSDGDVFKDSSLQSNDGDQFYGHIYSTHEDGPFVVDVTSDREAFKNLYKWSYRFALDIETGQRTLPLDMALSMWQLVFSKRLQFFDDCHSHFSASMTHGEEERFPSSDDVQTTTDYLTENGGLHLSCNTITDMKHSRSMDLSKQSEPSQQISSNDGLTGAFVSLQLKDEDEIILASLGNALPLVRSWFCYLFSLRGTLRGITRDTWDMFFTFIENVGEDGSGYNDAEAWPSLFDDFIEWLTDKLTPV